MKVNITADHIARGVKDKPLCCPIALMVQGVLAPAYVPEVTTRALFIWQNGALAHRVPMPEEGAWFIQRFDHDFYVEPMTLDLDIPAQYLRESDAYDPNREI